MGTPWDMLKAFLLTASAWFSAEGFSFWGPGVWDSLSRVRADKRIYLISLLL